MPEKLVKMLNSSSLLENLIGKVGELAQSKFFVIESSSDT